MRTCCSSSTSVPWRGQLRHDAGRLVGRVQHPDAPAVVASGGRLDDDRPAVPGGELIDRGGIGGDRPGRDRHAEFGEPVSHHRLVLGEAQRVRAGRQHDPVLGQGAQVQLRNVLVVERHDLAAAGEVAQVRQRAVVAHDHIGRDQRGPVVRRLGQDPQRLTQSDRRLVRHPGQLPGPDHADHRQSGAGVHGL